VRARVSKARDRLSRLLAAPVTVPVNSLEQP
jgi:hypothetical protein